jgi:hypothetical protein
MAQKNATPTKEQAETICKAGLKPDCWLVVKELLYIMYIRNRQTEEVRKIGK